MTKPKAETVEEPNPDVEPDEQIEGDDTDLEEEEAEQPETPVEPEGPSSYTLDQQWKRENERHIEAVKVFMGDEFEELVCQKCGGSGFSDIPLTLLDMYVADKTKEACPNCAARGQLATPSLVEGQQTVVCIVCSGLGWINKQATASSPPIAYTAPNTATAPTNGLAYGYQDANGVFVPFVPVPSS